VLAQSVIVVIIITGTSTTTTDCSACSRSRRRWYWREQLCLESPSKEHRPKITWSRRVEKARAKKNHTRKSVVLLFTSTSS